MAAGDNDDELALATGATEPPFFARPTAAATARGISVGFMLLFLKECFVLADWDDDFATVTDLEEDFFALPIFRFFGGCYQRWDGGGGLEGKEFTAL